MQTLGTFQTNFYGFHESYHFPTPLTWCLPSPGPSSHQTLWFECSWKIFECRDQDQCHTGLDCLRCLRSAAPGNYIVSGSWPWHSLLSHLRPRSLLTSVPSLGIISTLSNMSQPSTFSHTRLQRLMLSLSTVLSLITSPSISLILGCICCLSGGPRYDTTTFLTQLTESETKPGVRAECHSRMDCRYRISPSFLHPKWVISDTLQLPANMSATIIDLKW